MFSVLSDFIRTHTHTHTHIGPATSCREYPRGPTNLPSARDEAQWAVHLPLEGFLVLSIETITMSETAQ